MKTIKVKKEEYSAKDFMDSFKGKYDPKEELPFVSPQNVIDFMKTEVKKSLEVIAFLEEHKDEIYVPAYLFFDYFYGYKLKDPSKRIEILMKNFRDWHDDAVSKDWNIKILDAPEKYLK